MPLSYTPSESYGGPRAATAAWDTQLTAKLWGFNFAEGQNTDGVIKSRLSDGRGSDKKTRLDLAAG
jgi:hypothetical protein